VLSSKKSIFKKNTSLLSSNHKIKVVKKLNKAINIRRNFVRSLIVTILILIDLLVMLCFFEAHTLNTQFVFSFFCPCHAIMPSSFSLKLYLGIDRLSVIFLILTVYTFPVCILAS
jgi:NADH:ubiquinone oxidoreductase subunit 4 (subunit M)